MASPANVPPTEDLLRVTPAGHLLPSSKADEGPTLGPDVSRALDALRGSAPSGLFELAARSFRGGLPSQLAWWRDLASRYLGEICHTPAGTAHLEPVPAPPPSDIAELLLSAPPMPGAEYLTAELIAGFWTSLDEWVRRQAAAAGGLEAFLEARAPRWKQVGRVCFHLAENKKDPAYPFAFLATYAPRLSGSARVRYQPLGRALQEFAGERDRKALVHLLTPVQKASEKSDLVRALVDSGDIYHALAWTPEEAYRFLQEVSLYEESGILVRLPDWWTRRSRPQVAVRIGSESRSLLGADAVLDFRVETVIGGAALTEAEVRKLLAGSDGLAFLKGQWVEVDRARLSQALEHWKGLEDRFGKDGISFAEGMRLLAGAPGSLNDAAEVAATAWAFVDAGPWLRSILERLRAPATIEAQRAPAGLEATLRPYHRRSLAASSFQPRTRCVSGGRHGAGKDPSGADAPSPPSAREGGTVAAGASRFAPGQLESRDGALHSGAARGISPPFVRVSVRAAGRPPELGWRRCRPDDVRNAAPSSGA
jgi:hypothetical protein